ncbi:DNA processing protein [Dysgonomonadaceae bacterium PH5-43]|nr:DNA processing protein [Dysgonomonadaceae bacterium PH5-43]
MNNQNLLYEIGITLVKGIGSITARQVVNTLGDVSSLFTEKKRLLERIPGISHKIISEIQNPEVLRRAEKEIAFINKSNIKPLFFTDKDYPDKLKDCIDAPVMLYFKGDCNFNTDKSISIVGTRNATNYGKEIIEALMKDISEQYPNIIIFSGLAYGIDIAAHKAALKHNVSTVGVLAHGLDRIYPLVHRNTAIEMISNGGLLTDFISETNPDRQNFIKRNRIVAGISDCTIIIESAEKGGALITASIADSYNKDVFAFPGKVTDPYSIGCNKLIKNKKASLITCADDLIREMNWGEQLEKPKNIQRPLFPDLSQEEQSIVDYLTNKDSAHVNNMSIDLNLPMSKLSPLLFELEMKGVVRCIPGGQYQL